ncbi:MAG TPA: tetratricopeptide repeat protein [Candidatus Sulfotelmatobacter sp.]|nr:tetratricopeptide repeat protein [Candidatus Sulfotelmatobacter sp.]
MNLRSLSSFLFVSLLLQQGFAAASPKELLAAGRVDDAIQVLQRQIEHAPTDAESDNLLCRAYFMLEEWDRGIPACERARNLDPQNSLYSLWLGRIYGEKASRVGFLSAAGLAKKVRTSFERAVELDPKSWEARTDLAEFYLEAPGIVGGGKDKARAQIDAIMPLNPGMAHWIAARIAEKNKDAAAAEHEYHASIAATHSGARAWLDFAIFLRHANRLDEMEQAVRNLESCPLDYPAALLDGGNVLLRAGRDYPLAIRLLQRYLTAPVEAGPAFKAHDVLGQILERQGDLRAAASEYRAALALAHTYARAQEDLKRVEH